MMLRKTAKISATIHCIQKMLNPTLWFGQNPTNPTNPTGPANPANPSGSSARSTLLWRIIAVVCGIIGGICALVFPLLPVTTQDIWFGWLTTSNQEITTNINAPMITLVPEKFAAAIPCDAISQLPHQQGLLLGTLPHSSDSSIKLGLFVRSGNTITVTDRGVELLSLDKTIALHSHCVITIVSNYQLTHVTAVGYPDAPSAHINSGILRPQVVGLYSDLSGTVSHIYARVKIDTRWESSPTALKIGVGILGIVLIIASVCALYKLDTVHTHRLPRKKLHFLTLPQCNATDFVVIAILGIWVFLGSSTSDDGYILTMAQMHYHSGYMVNFFRWWGASEDPFGWYYNILGVLAKINSSLWFMRLPAFFSGVASWFLISRFVLPRLGEKVKNLPAARWSAATGLLIIWLPLNNGLRPEPEVTLGMLIVWCLLEFAIATRKLFPVALAVFVAVLTVGAAPGGIMALAVLGVCSAQLLVNNRTRWHEDGILPIIIPIIATALSFLFIAFIDQPLGIVLDGIRAKTQAGPSLSWWQEPVRFFYLSRYPDVNGAANRRIGVYVTFFALITITIMLLNKKHLKHIAQRPAWRLVGITIGMLGALLLTPTKWTHHIGVYAIVTSCLAGLCGALIHPTMLANKALRSYLAAAILFFTAVSFGGSNGWWYVSSYGVPWSNSAPSIATSFGSVRFSTIIVVIAIFLAVKGIYYHCKIHYALLGDPTREKALPVSSSPPISGSSNSSSSHAPSTASANSRRQNIIIDGIKHCSAAPLATVLSCVLLFEIGSLGIGAYRQRNGFTWLSSNIATFSHHSCSLADKVLVEPDPNMAILRPANQLSALEALYGEHAFGFSPLGVPAYLQSEASPVDPITRHSNIEIGATNDQPLDPRFEDEITSDPTLFPRISADKLQLPYGLDQHTALAGSYGATGAAHLQSAWYVLPPRTSTTPVISIAAAGKIQGKTSTGYHTDGAVVYIRYAKKEHGVMHTLGTLTPLDPGPWRHWRNIRFPTAHIPSDAQFIQIVADTSALLRGQWVAITSPRMPTLVTANTFLGSKIPGLIDWLPAIAFPCQHQMQVHNGLVEIPHFRIQPDFASIEHTTNRWQDGHYGGPDGIIDTLLSARSIPSYLVGNWELDWGNIELLSLIRPGVSPQLIQRSTRHSGLWLPSPMRSSYN